MKTVALSVTLVALLTTPALAEATKAQIEDHYKTIVEQKPYTVQTCKEVLTEKEAPMDTGGAVVGGIIGGVIGNQIGKGSGKEAATAAGAITGAIIGGKNGKKEYQTRQHCEYVTTYKQIEKTVYSHSTITFYDNGHKYTLNFSK